MVRKLIWLDSPKSSDLNVYHVGQEDCAPGHSFGPAVRDHFLIHYISSGQGEFIVGEQMYHLKAGQGFLICPGIVTFYQADADNPWCYSWIGFSGLKAQLYLKHSGLSMDNPVFSYNKDGQMQDCFNQIAQTRDQKRNLISRDIRLLGLLYQFLALLIECCDSEERFNDVTNKQELYVKSAVSFVETNYSQKKTSVAAIANHLALNRSYFGSVFKRYTGVTPQDFLVNFRIDKACELLESTNLSIGDIARSVGYDDPLIFSKAFKKIKGSSPRNYRNLLTS